MILKKRPRGHDRQVIGGEDGEKRLVGLGHRHLLRRDDGRLERLGRRGQDEAAAGHLAHRAHEVRQLGVLERDAHQVARPVQRGYPDSPLGVVGPCARAAAGTSTRAAAARPRGPAATADGRSCRAAATSAPRIPRNLALRASMLWVGHQRAPLPPRPGLACRGADLHHGGLPRAVARAAHRRARWRAGARGAAIRPEHRLADRRPPRGRLSPRRRALPARGSGLRGQRRPLGPGAARGHARPRRAPFAASTRTPSPRSGTFHAWGRRSRSPPRSHESGRDADIGFFIRSATGHRCCRRVSCSSRARARRRAGRAPPSTTRRTGRSSPRW